MKRAAAFLIIFARLLTSIPCHAQLTDSLQNKLKDTLPPIIRWETSERKNVLPYRAILLPTALVAYGVASLNSKDLSHLNETIKDEVYSDRSSPHKFHLDNYLQFGPAAAVYGLNIAGIKGKNNFRDRSMLYGLSELIMSTTVFSVKKLAGETRPDGSDKYSFPSGHTASAFAAAEFMRQEYKDKSPWYGVAGYAMAAATGYLRVYNNKHWMGDVVAGAGVGIISTKLAYWIYPAIKRKLFKNKDVSTIVMPTYNNGSAGFGLVHKF